MFARVFALLPLALLASASAIGARDGDSQCSTGSISCCNSYQSIDQAMDMLKQLDLVDAAVQAGAGVGVTCTPITVIGAGNGNKCNSQAVCCSGNNFNGLLNVGCSPISL